jgi:hypothetical protein
MHKLFTFSITSLSTRLIPFTPDMFNTVSIYTDLDSKCPVILIGDPIFIILDLPEYYNRIGISNERFILRIIKRIKSKYFKEIIYKDIVPYLLQFIEDNIQKEFYYLLYLCE